MNFIQACLKGEAKPEDIDDWVEKWHKSQSKSALHQWLGMTLSEYMDWVGNPNSLQNIIDNAKIRLSQPRTKKKYPRKRKKREQ